MISADDIKLSVSLDALLDRLGIEPDRSRFISCPAHTDKTPSLKVYDNGKGWYCYSCNNGGSVIDFYMHYQKCNFRQAIEDISRMFALTGGDIDRTALYRNKRALTEVELAQQDEDKWLAEVIKYRKIIEEPTVDGEISEARAKAYHMYQYACYRWEGARDRVARLTKRKQ